MRTVELGSPVTDLDLSPTGAFVLAVLRAENAYVRLALPGGLRRRRGPAIAAC